MKPIKLHISGLNSFRQEQIIDFSLISDTGIFGIFGPTGSGKSSILDAITLCLYGRVERSDANRTGIINQQEERIYVKFVFDLTLNNTSQRYYVERVYNRMDQLRVKSTVARLVKVEANQEVVLADKEKEVTKAVEELLGLTVDDFTRAVVLPQGKFAEFLTLKAQDRRPMLERLFHLDEYGKKLKDKSQRRENELKQQRDEILTKQAMLSHATAENLTVIEEKLKQEEAKRLELNQQLEDFLANFKNTERIWGVQAELELVEKQLDIMDQRFGYISLLKQKKENAEKAAIIEPTLNNFLNLEKQLDSINKIIIDLTFKQQHLLAEAKDYQANYEESKRLYEKYFPLLSDKKYKLQEALEIEKEMGTIQSLINSYDIDKQSLTTENANLKAQQNELENAIKQIAKDISNIKIDLEKTQITTEERKQLDNALQIRQSLMQTKGDLTAIDDELTSLHAKIVDREQKSKEQFKKIGLLSTEHQVLEQRLASYKDVKLSSESWLLNEKALLEREHNISKIFDQHSELIKLSNENKEVDNKIMVTNSEIDQMLHQIKVKEELVLSKKSILSDLEAYQKINIAIKLAEELETGKPCIVCGSTQHPEPKTVEHLDKSSEEKIAQIEGELLELEIDMNQAKIDLKTAENSLKSLATQRESLISGIAQKEKQIKELIEALPEEYQNLQVKELRSKLEEDKEKQILVKKQIEAKSHEHEELLEQSKAFKEELDNEQQSYKVVLSEIAMVKETIEKIVNSKKQLIEKLSSIEASWNNVKNGWELDTIEKVKEEIEQMDLRREELQKNLKGLDVILEAKQQTFLQLTTEKQTIEGKLSTIDIAYKKDSDSLNKLAEKYQQITAGSKANDLLAEINDKLDKLKEGLSDSEQQMQAKATELNDAENSLSSNKAVMANITDQHKEVKAQLAHLMQKYNILSITDLKDYLLTNDELEKLAKEIKDYENNLNLLISKKKELQEQIKDKEISKEEWITQNEQKISLEEELEVVKNLCSELSFQLKELKKDYLIWNELEAERTIIQGDLDIASELNQVLRGNGFIDFVAQEYLYNITIIASGKLRQLTRNRFSLDIDQDGGFKLVDELNGGQSRPVQSLSGGETFLTSLSLALALSSQIQLKGGQMLEFFFLDEGFGSLDSDLLDTVMMTLEKLHAGHMLIGIISHVPELQSRIDRKIIVTPADTKGNGSTITIEYS